MELSSPEPSRECMAAGTPRTFATTHWSIVLSAGAPESAQAREALEKLCRTYWYPLYTYIRRRGSNAAEAEDLTQEFFLRLLDKNYLAQVDPRKGRFRSFLLVAVNHFLANEWDKTRAVKRGGRMTFLSWDELSAEQRYLREPGTAFSPEKAFEQRWAMAQLEQVLARLREEFAANGKKVLFDELKIFLTGPKRSVSYAALAAKLGSTEP